MQNELTAERIAAAIRVVETEQKCVMRNADGYCDRQCEKCDLLMLVAEILGGYDTALAALRAEQERQGEFGRLFLEYSGCPRGALGRSCAPIEDEVLAMPVITDIDGGRWVPVNEEALHELVKKSKGGRE